MKSLNRKKFIALSFLLIALAVFTLPVPARAQEVNDANLLDPNLEAELQMPGTIEGTGTYFEVTDSNYLNITFESTEPVHLRLESVPEMVVMDINTADGAASTQITLTGFAASTTYYKYEDDYHNGVPFITDDNGTYTYAQDLSQPHLVFIQTNPGTIFLSDSGWSDLTVGTWDPSTKTGTLTRDVYETIQIDEDNLTLDGAGHTVAGPGSGYGVYLNGRGGVTIKNINVHQFTDGIFLYNSINNTLTGNTTNSSTHTGITLSRSSGNTLTNNTASNNSNGISLWYSSSNALTDNTASNNSSGIHLRVCSGSTLTGNTASNNKSGISLLFCSGSTLTDNTANWNWESFGIFLQASGGSMLRGNTMSGNRYNFGVSGFSVYQCSDSDFDNDIDTTNTVDGKPIYYVKNAANQVYNSSTNAGTFYAINCENITIKDLTLTKNWHGVFLWKTHNSRIENVTASNNLGGIKLYYSSYNTLTGNTVNSNYEDGISLFYYSSGNTLTENISSNNIYGIYLCYYNENNTLANNNASNNYYGISLYHSSSNTLTGNTASNNYWGISLYYSSNNTLTGNTTNSKKFWDEGESEWLGSGIYMVHSSGNTLSCNTVSNNYYGIRLYSSSDNQIYNNNFIDNETRAYVSGSGNVFNLDKPIGGNYWSDWTSPDADGDGFVDYPYVFTGGVDYLPLASPYVSELSVEIDIKPGSYPNAINLGSYGLVPVAILSSEDFDATTVNPDSVELAGASVAVRGKSNKYMAHEEDVNGDELVDLLLQVATENLDTGSFQDGYAVVTGETYDGVSIEGQDEITIVPPE